MSENESKELTLNLRPAKRAPRYRRTERIVAEIRGQIAQQLRIDASEVRLSEELNRFVWSHGGRSYLPRITVLMKKDEEGVTTVQPPSEIKRKKKPNPRKQKKRQKRKQKPRLIKQRQMKSNQLSLRKYSQHLIWNLKL